MEYKEYTLVYAGNNTLLKEILGKMKNSNSNTMDILNRLADEKSMSCDELVKLVKTACIDEELVNLEDYK